jgi:hypothetical protein
MFFKKIKNDRIEKEDKVVIKAIALASVPLLIFSKNILHIRLINLRAARYRYRALTWILSNIINLKLISEIAA